MISTKGQIANLERAKLYALKTGQSGEIPRLDKMLREVKAKELRAKVKELEARYFKAKKEGNEEEVINLYSAICELQNLLEKQADAINAKMHMELRRGFGMN